MDNNARNKLLELTRLMVHRFQQHQTVNLYALTAEHGGDEYRATLAKILEMLEVWLAIRASNKELEPQEFADGFGAAEHVCTAFIEAVDTWRLCETDSTDSDVAPGDVPPQRESRADDVGHDSDQESIVTGQSLVSVRNWSGCGIGGLGEVGDGIDVVLQRDVAVKSPRHPSYPRFEKEILLTGSFVHPHIIPVFSLAFNKDGKPAFIMPQVKGGTLLNEINEHHLGKLTGLARDRSTHSLLKHVVTVARTVHYAHSRTPAVMHRDLKPENFLIDRDGNVFVADWGLGYRADQPEEPTPGFGTVYYAAPEQWAGTKQGISINGERVMNAIRANYSMAVQLALANEVQHGKELPEACEAVGIGFVELLGKAGYNLGEEFARPGRLADIYSLGAVLYHAVTGQRPFSNSSNSEKLENRYVAPEKLVPGVDPELTGIIRRAMATKPEDRYASAGELADDLERVLGRFVDEPVKAFKAGEEPLKVRIRRKVRKHAGSIAALLILFGLTGIAGFSCTAERHIALQNEQERARAEVQDARRTSDRDVKAEKERAEAAIRVSNENADKFANTTRVAATKEVATAKADADRKVREQEEKAAKEIEAERQRTKKAESERDELRRQLSRAELRSKLSATIEKAQQGPRRALTDAQRATIDRFARSVELNIAGSEAERLETRRAYSREIGSHVLREDILRRTAPEATNWSARPRLEIADTIVLDHHSRIVWEKPPSSKAAQEFRDRIVRICEHDGAMLDRIHAWTQTPKSPNPSFGLMHNAIDLVDSGRAEGVSAQVAQESAEYRRLIWDRVLHVSMTGGSLDDAIKAARFDKPGDFVNLDFLKQADAACVREFKRFPNDDTIISKLRNYPPSVDGLEPGIRPDTQFGKGPPDEPPGINRPKGPRPVQPGGGSVGIELSKPRDLTQIIDRMARTGEGRGIVSPDYALTYDDLLPPRAEPRNTSLYNRLADEHLKAAKLPPRIDAPRIDPHKLKGIGSPQAAMQRSFSFSRLRGFHRVGGTVFEHEPLIIPCDDYYRFLPIPLDLP